MEKTKEIAVSTSPLEVSSTDLAMVMKAEAEKRTLITQYIAHHMKSGTDYGTIKFGGKESKPSLFKPGSEKFLSLFKLTAQFEKDTDTWEMAGSESGVFAYKCRLLDSKKRLVGEGRGVSKLSEKQGWTINNAVKIAEKRAQIDAVLRTGALSDFFTQDLEDMAQAASVVYDQTPIEDKAIPTVHIGGESLAKANRPKVVSELGQKKEIMDLIDSIVQVPLPRTKQAYSDWVFEQTSCNLEDPKEYPAIIGRLTRIKSGESIGE